jgi:hypothetical protein
MGALKIRLLEWWGKVLNLAGYPAVVRPCDYMGPLGVRVRVRVSPLYTVVSVGGVDIYFGRTTGKIDGTGFIRTSDCMLDEALQLIRSAAPSPLPPPQVHKRKD